MASIGGNGVTGCGGVVSLLSNGNGASFLDQGPLAGICSEDGSVGIADFNHDKYLDIAAAAVCSQFCGPDPVLTVERLFFGGASGTFPSQTDYTVPVGSPDGTIAADLNGDGSSDLVTTCTSSSCSAFMQVFVNNGDATLSPGPSLSGDNTDLAAGTFSPGCPAGIASVGNDLTILLHTSGSSCAAGSPAPPPGGTDVLKVSFAGAGSGSVSAEGSRARGRVRVPILMARP